MLSYIGYVTNYKIVNQSNLHNLMYLTLDEMDITNKRKYIDRIKLIMGKTYLDDLKFYIYEKFKDSELLNLIF